MPREKASDEDLVRKLAGVRRRVERVGLTGDTGDAGTPRGGSETHSWNPMTTAGDLIYGGTAGAALRRGIGAEGQALIVSGGVPAWGAAGDAAGQYRLYTLIPDGDSFLIVNDGLGNPVYTLEGLE